MYPVNVNREEQKNKADIPKKTKKIKHFIPIVVCLSPKIIMITKINPSPAIPIKIYPI